MIGAFLDETQSRSTMWARWENFFRDHHEPSNFLKLVPGLGQRDMSTLSALGILRRDLHDLTRYALIHTQTVDVLCATVLYPKPRHDTRVIVQPIAYGSSKGSSLNRPVWIARLDVVERAVREGRLDTISCLGIRGWIVGEHSLRCVLEVRPRFTSLPDGTGIESSLDEGGERVVLVMNDSMHRVYFLYNTFRLLASQCS